jgi:hypothetical protein
LISEVWSSPVSAASVFGGQLVSSRSLHCSTDASICIPLCQCLRLRCHATIPQVNAVQPMLQDALCKTYSSCHQRGMTNLLWWKLHCKEAAVVVDSASFVALMRDDVDTLETLARLQRCVTRYRLGRLMFGSRLQTLAGRSLHQVLEAEFEQATDSQLKITREWQAAVTNKALDSVASLSKTKERRM